MADSWLPNSGDHGDLTGRDDDDHTGYFILAGRSGGQTAYGSTVTAETLVLAANSADTIDNQILLNADGTVSFLNGVKIDPHIGTGATCIVIGGDATSDNMIIKANSVDANSQLELLGIGASRLLTGRSQDTVRLTPQATDQVKVANSATANTMTVGGTSTSGFAMLLSGGAVTSGGGLIITLDSDIVQAGNRFIEYRGGSALTTVRWKIEEDGSIIHAPGATGVMLDWELETEWTTGSLLRADFGGATTLTGDIIGWEIDFDANVTLDGNNAFAFKITVPTGEVAINLVKGTIDLNSQGSILNIGNTSSNLAADAWTISGANQQVMNISTSGAATDSTLAIKTPASSTGSNEISFEQGDATGSANNMAYILKYDGNAADFALESKDIDGASADSDIFVISDGTNDVKFIGGISTDGVSAPISGIDSPLIQTDRLRTGVSGGITGAIEIDGLTNGTVTVSVLDVAGTWTMTLPAAVGGAGDQLTDAAGNGVTTWAAAASLRKFKNILRKVNPYNALDAILNATPYQFRYKKRSKRNTGDFDTVYSGIMAEDAPWAMHHKGEVFSPISAFGYTVAAFQALEKRIKELESKIDS